MAKRIKIKDLLNSTDFGQEAIVMGWVKTFRNNQFIAINDGSTIKNIQAVVDFNSFDDSVLKRLTTGAAISLRGEIVESLGKGQRIEIKVNTLEILGDSDAEKFPLSGVFKGNCPFTFSHQYLQCSIQSPACTGLCSP